MVWVRRFFVQIFSLAFLISLLGLAFSVSVNVNLGQPAKLQGVLKESKIYDHFVTNIIEQSEKSAEKGTSGSGISFDNPEVQAAAQSAFSPELVENSFNDIIEGHYSWLEGKTATPQFNVDLSDAKKSFAEEVGDYVAARLNGLPKCTPEQTKTLSPDLDPMQLTCLPANVNPVTEGERVENELLAGGGFLDKTVITPETLSSNPDGNAEPYYLKLASAPQMYQLAHKLPLILAVLAILSAVLILVISPVRRKGLRRIGVVTVWAGILLVVSKMVADFVFNKMQAKMFNGSEVGPLQASLTNAAQRTERGLVGIILLFGIAYLVLGLIILIYIFATRGKKPPVIRERQEVKDEIIETPAVPVNTIPRPVATGVPPLKQPQKPKKPKLIQL